MNRPFVGFEPTRDNAKQRGLARAINPDNAQSIVIGNGDGEVMKDWRSTSTLTTLKLPRE
jgi:hypothetical protein